MTHTPRFIAYYRVSTQQQGRSGLGLDAQKDAVARQIASVSGRLVESFEEIESGKNNARPALAAALAACRAHKATLLVAKLDRLARNTRFLLTVVEGSGEGGVCFCDLPQIQPGATGKFILTLFAAVAELEAGLISARTKAALAQAKARGVRLGNPNIRAGTPEMAAIAAAATVQQADDRAADVAPYIEQAKRAGCTTLAEIAAALNNRGISSPRGSTWRPTTVSRALARHLAPPSARELAARGMA